MMALVQRLLIAAVLALPLVAGGWMIAGQGHAAEAGAGQHGKHHAMQADSPAAMASTPQENGHSAATAQDCCLVACPVTALEHVPPVLRRTVKVTPCTYVQHHEVAASRQAPPRERPPRLHG